MLLTPAIIRCIIRHRSGLYTCIQLLGKQEFFRKTSQISAKEGQKPIKIGQNSSKRKPTAKPKSEVHSPPKSEVHTEQSGAQPSRAHGAEQARCRACQKARCTRCKAERNRAERTAQSKHGARHRASKVQSLPKQRGASRKKPTGAEQAKKSISSL